MLTDIQNLHKLNPNEPMSCSEICDVKLIFLLTLFLCSCYYYNNDNDLEYKSNCQDQNDVQASNNRMQTENNVKD